MWWYTEGYGKVEKERKDIKGGVRERDGGAYCFCGKLMWSIWAMWLLQHTPWVTSATPKGNWNCMSPPSFFSLFFFFSGNKRRCMLSILLWDWASKTTACSYMYHSPSSPKTIYREQTHTHTHPLRCGHVVPCFPGHFLWSCCFIVFADPISLPLWCDFSFCCPDQSYSHGSPGKEK